MDLCCIICLEPCRTPPLCLCRAVYHTECFSKWIESCGEVTCCVCRREVKGWKIVSVERKVVPWRTFLIASSVVVSFISMSCFVAAYFSTGHDGFFYTSTGFMISMMIGVFLMVSIFFEPSVVETWVERSAIRDNTFDQ